MITVINSDPVYPKVYPEDYAYLINRIFWAATKARSNVSESLSNAEGEFDKVSEYMANDLHPGLLDSHRGSMYDVLLFFKDRLDAGKIIEPLDMSNLLNVVNKQRRMVDLTFAVYPYMDDGKKSKFDEIPMPEDVFMQVKQGCALPAGREE